MAPKTVKNFRILIRNIVLTLAVCAALSALTAGCAPPEKPVQARPAVEPLGGSVDACADRMHEIGGQLLMYYAVNKALPEKLEDLNKPRIGGEKVELVCPTSNKPYVYNKEGLEVDGIVGYIVVYDPEPCHNNMRWCITFDEPKPGHRLASDVIRLPDSRLFLRDLNWSATSTTLPTKPQ